MPIKRRRVKARRADLEKLTDEQVRHLTYGWHFFPDSGFGDRETFAAAWDMHRERLLPAWITEHPGTRPFGWWLCDHKQERPVAAWATPETVERFRQDPPNWEHFGFLHTNVLMGPPVNGMMMPLQDPETDYLRRHKLLTAAERSQLEER